MVLQGVRAAPGVVRGAHERLWWVFDGDATRSAIGVAEEDEEEGQEEDGTGRKLPLPSGSEVRRRRKEEVAEQLRGFLTRYVIFVFFKNIV